MWICSLFEGQMLGAEKGMLGNVGLRSEGLEIQIRGLRRARANRWCLGENVTGNGNKLL